MLLVPVGFVPNKIIPQFLKLMDYFRIERYFGGSYWYQDTLFVYVHGGILIKYNPESNLIHYARIPLIGCTSFTFEKNYFIIYSEKRLVYVDLIETFGTHIETNISLYRGEGWYNDLLCAEFGPHHVYALFTSCDPGRFSFEIIVINPKKLTRTESWFIQPIKTEAWTEKDLKFEIQCFNEMKRSFLIKIRTTSQDNIRTYQIDELSPDDKTKCDTIRFTYDCSTLLNSLSVFSDIYSSVYIRTSRRRWGGFIEKTKLQLIEWKT